MNYVNIFVHLLKMWQSKKNASFHYLRNPIDSTKDTLHDTSLDIVSMVALDIVFVIHSLFLSKCYYDSKDFLLFYCIDLPLGEYFQKERVNYPEHTKCLFLVCLILKHEL